MSNIVTMPNVQVQPEKTLTEEYIEVERFIEQVNLTKKIFGCKKHARTYVHNVRNHARLFLSGEPC